MEKKDVIEEIEKSDLSDPVKNNLVSLVLQSWRMVETLEGRRMRIEGKDLDCIIDMYDIVCIEGQETRRMRNLVEEIKKGGRL